MQPRHIQNKNPPAEVCRRKLLLDVGVVADMLFTVAVIAAAAGAVAELQIRMGQVGLAANCTAVGIGSLLGGCCVILGCGGSELDDLGAGCGLTAVAADFIAPGSGHQVQNIAAKEQQVVGDGNDGEEVGGEGIGNKIIDHQTQIEQTEEPGLDRDDEEQQKMGIGIHGGETQEQAEVQIGDAGITTENHAVDIHHHNTAEIKQIKPEGAPCIFDGSSQRVITEERNADEQQIAVTCAIGEGIGEESPDLTVENAGPIEAEQIVKGVVARDLDHHINDGSTDCNVQHQIRNAFVAVFVTEPVELCAKVFHSDSTPNVYWLHFTSIAEKSL